MSSETFGFGGGFGAGMEAMFAATEARNRRIREMSDRRQAAARGARPPEPGDIDPDDGPLGDDPQLIAAWRYGQAVWQGVKLAEAGDRPQGPDRATTPDPEYHGLSLLAGAAGCVQTFALVLNAIVQDHAESIRELKAENSELRARVGALEGAGGGDAAVFDSGDTFDGGKVFGK